MKLEADSVERRTTPVTGAVLALVAAGVFVGVAPNPPAPRAAHEIGAAARDFTYEDINPNSPTHGQRLALSDLWAERGIVLNFLASWCQYCWTELPELEGLKAADAATIVGVAADEYAGPEILLRQLAAKNLTMPILLVPQDDIAAMERDYDHRILPTTYVIDKQGRIRRVFQGVAPHDELLAEIRENLGS